MRSCNSILSSNAACAVSLVLVEEVSITSANINDGKAGPGALPDNPGEVFAYRSNHFRDAVKAKGGVLRIVATGIWGRDE